eukprot:s272_g4.t2
MLCHGYVGAATRAQSSCPEPSAWCAMELEAHAELSGGGSDEDDDIARFERQCALRAQAEGYLPDEAEANSEDEDIRVRQKQLVNGSGAPPANGGEWQEKCELLQDKLSRREAELAQVKNDLEMLRGEGLGPEDPQIALKQRLLDLTKKNRRLQVSVDGQRVRLQQLEAEAKRPKEEAKKLAEEMAMQNAALLYGEGGNVEDWKKKYLATSNQLQQVRHELQELRTQTQKQKKVLLKELGTDESIQQVNYFGPNARDMIKDSMKQDQVNAQNLKQMEADLRANGDWECKQNEKATYPKVKHVRDSTMHSFKQVRPMRRHIRDIADLLRELMDPKIQCSETSMRSVLLGIQKASEKAQMIAADGQEKFQSLGKQLQDMQKEYQTKMEAAKKKTEEAEKSAKCKEQEAAAFQRSSVASGSMAVVSGSVPLAKSGIGVVALAGGAEAVAGIPVIGSALTTTTVGWFTTTVAFNPVGIMVGAGFAVGFGILSLKNVADAWACNAQKETALHEKNMAEKQVEECESVVKSSETSKQVAHRMASSAETHGTLWSGVSEAAEALAQTYDSLQDIGRDELRRAAFDSKMEDYIEDLVNLAIDEYLFYLDKTGFSPPNFGCERVAMAVADDPLAVQWKGRAAQIAQLQRQLKDFKASSCTDGGRPTAQVQESAATLAPAVTAAAKNKAVAQAADKRREEFDRLQEEVEKLRQEQTECKRKRDALKSRAVLLESQLRDLKAHVQFLLRKSDDDDALVSMLQKQLGREDAEFQEAAGSDAALRQQNAELQAQLERQAQIVLQLRQKALAASCENGSVPLGPKSVEASVTERQLLERVRFLEAENAKQAQQVQLLKAREAVGGSFNGSSSSFRDHFRDAVDIADR